MVSRRRNQYLYHCYYHINSNVNWGVVRLILDSDNLVQTQSCYLMTAGLLCLYEPLFCDL